MNRKRSWPGVPNRYSHRLPGSEMRPKSMATVVVVLRSVTPPASSTPTECSVIAASVDSGSMSEIDPMKVVLPTANPPATTIFDDGGSGLVGRRGRLPRGRTAGRRQSEEMPLRTLSRTLRVAALSSGAAAVQGWTWTG